jgi:hypothetical protein
MVYVLIVPFLIYKLFKTNKNEAKLHVVGIVFYSVVVNVHKFSHIEEYVYLLMNFIGGKIDTPGHFKIPASFICYQIVNPFHLIVAMILVWFKRSEDIFMSFSKIDSLAQVSNFQVLVKKHLDSTYIDS